LNRSFRFRLSARFTAAMVAGLLVLSVFTYMAIRGALDREINASLLAVASIQASSLTDAPTGEMRFHEWELTPDEAAQVRDLNRFAQVWSEDGRSLLRMRYITSDLPLDTGIGISNGIFGTSAEGAPLAGPGQARRAESGHGGWARGDSGSGRRRRLDSGRGGVAL
jgi:hypothetical protein